MEKCVKAVGKLSIDLEHFIDDFSQTLKQEFEDRGFRNFNYLIQVFTNFFSDVSNAKLNEFISGMDKHILPLAYNLHLLNAFRLIKPNEFNFLTFDQFFNQRLSKTKLRFINRNIYCFMCEMKARRQMNANHDSKEDSKKPKEFKLKDESSFRNEQQNQLIERYIREGKLFGLAIKNQEQLTLYNLVEENLSQLQSEFMQTTIEANHIFQSNIISPQFLDCLPDHVITQLNHHDIQSVYDSFLRYCPDQYLRRDFWLSYQSRVQAITGKNSNTLLQIEKIRKFRKQKALLLGYENFVQMALKLRTAGLSTMAEDIENVRAFINGLAVRSETNFSKNFKELTDFASDLSIDSKKLKDKQFLPTNVLIENLNLWDLKYFERLFLKEKYQLNSRDMIAHFPMDKVISGMFDFCEKLFGIKIVEIKEGKNVWGPNVRQYKVFDNSSRSTAEYGSFYFDPFQRESRIFTAISRCESLNTKPVVFFFMNYHNSGSIFDQYDTQQLCTGKELLNFYQVVQLFGKASLNPQFDFWLNFSFFQFGFVLQQLLSDVTLSEVSGLSNIEADAFNIVSHFMQMWPLNCYQVLANCSSHIKTGQPISEEFFERIRKCNSHFFWFSNPNPTFIVAYYHFVSLSLKHELYLMALDLNLHSKNEHATVVQKQTWTEWMSPFESYEDSHLCSLVDIFKGNGLEGIYYSNKWSEVRAS